MLYNALQRACQTPQNCPFPWDLNPRRLILYTSVCRTFRISPICNRHAQLLQIGEILDVRQPLVYNIKRRGLDPLGEGQSFGSLIGPFESIVKHRILQV